MNFNLFQKITHKTTYVRNIVETIISHYGLNHLIHDPIHILENSSKCIDLIFTFESNVPILHLTLITTAKLYLQIWFKHTLSPTL